MQSIAAGFNKYFKVLNIKNKKEKRNNFNFQRCKTFFPVSLNTQQYPVLFHTLFWIKFLLTIIEYILQFSRKIAIHFCTFR